METEFALPLGVQFKPKFLLWLLTYFSIFFLSWQDVVRNYSQVSKAAPAKSGADSHTRGTKPHQSCCNWAASSRIDGSPHHLFFWVWSTPTTPKEDLATSTWQWVEFLLALFESEPPSGLPAHSTSLLTLVDPQESAMPSSSSSPEDGETQTPHQPLSNTIVEFALGNIYEVEIAHVRRLSLITLADEMNKAMFRVTLSNCQHLYNCFAAS